jgi:hypothetical protein
MLPAIKNCNTLHMIQSAKHNDKCALDIRAMGIDFELIPEIREYV